MAFEQFDNMTFRAKPVSILISYFWITAYANLQLNDFSTLSRQSGCEIKTEQNQL